MYHSPVFSKLIAAIVTGLAISPMAHANVYYVNNANAFANDYNPGTIDLPFRTISHATALAVAGDTINVSSGTYAETVTIANSGTPDLPIRLTAQGTVIIEPPAVVSWTGGINVLGKTDIIVDGFTVQNAYFGIKIDTDNNNLPSQRVLVWGNHTVMTASSGIRVARSNNVSVYFNVVEKANYNGIHEMITVTNTDGFAVIGNEVFNGPFFVNGVAVDGKEGIDAKGATSNGNIAYNKVHDLTRLGIYLDAWSSLEQNIRVFNNVVYNCKQGIALSSENGGTLRDVAVFNNVTYGNARYGIILAPWGLDGRRENINISNNTVYGNQAGGISIGTTNAGLITLQNNIAADNVGPQLSEAAPGLVTTSSNNLVQGQELGNINVGTLIGDPRFVNAGAGDFRLGIDSAAVNTGVTLPWIPLDFAGTWRPLGNAYDIGAFESY